MPRWSKLSCLALVAGAMLLAFDTPEDRGKDLFARRCSGCHTLDLNKEGPRLRGVYGRDAASVSGFPYSDALRSAHVRWDEANLDRWLSDPDSVASGNDMEFRLKDAAERTAIIAYLKSLDVASVTEMPRRYRRAADTIRSAAAASISVPRSTMARTASIATTLCAFWRTALTTCPSACAVVSGPK
jgi:cytochrome c